MAEFVDFPENVFGSNSILWDYLKKRRQRKIWLQRFNEGFDIWPIMSPPFFLLLKFKENWILILGWCLESDFKKWQNKGNLLRKRSNFLGFIQNQILTSKRLKRFECHHHKTTFRIFDTNQIIHWFLFYLVQSKEIPKPCFLVSFNFSDQCSFWFVELSFLWDDVVRKTC